MQRFVSLYVNTVAPLLSVEPVTKMQKHLFNGLPVERAQRRHEIIGLGEAV